MKTFRCSNTTRLCSVVSALICSLILTSTSYASDVRKIWQSGDQFVALEHHDSTVSETAISNDHPVELSPDRLTAMLTSIVFQPDDSDKPVHLFTNQSVGILVPEIVQGFRKSASGEDVIFAIVGLHKSMLGFGKNPKVTTGRAFYNGGRFNIIFGLAQKDVNEREDRRLSPFTPGNRLQALKGEWTLLPQPGISGFTLVRKDWVAFSDEWQGSVAQMPVVKLSATSSQTEPVQSGERYNDTRGPAERLLTLNELKDKGLISEEEYRSKRLEILKGL